MGIRNFLNAINFTSLECNFLYVYNDEIYTLLRNSFWKYAMMQFTFSFYIQKLVACVRWCYFTQHLPEKYPKLFFSVFIFKTKNLTWTRIVFMNSIKKKSISSSRYFYCATLLAKIFVSVWMFPIVFLSRYFSVVKHLIYVWDSK